MDDNDASLSTLQKEFGEPVQTVTYEFGNMKMNEVDRLFNQLLYDVIKILWQKNDVQQRKNIILVFLILEERDNMTNTLQKGGKKSLYYIVFFALLVITNYYTDSYNNQSYREPSRQPLPKIVGQNPNYYKEKKELQIDELQIDELQLSTIQKTEIELYDQELVNFLRNVKHIMYYLKFINIFLDIVKSRTGNSIVSKSCVAIFKKIDNLLKATNTNPEYIQKSVTHGLKFFGFDMNKLIIDSGITISLGIADSIGFSDLLSEIISIGLSPELKFAFIIVPMMSESLVRDSESLLRELTPREFTQLISRGGKNKTKKQKSTKKKSQKKVKKRT